MPALGQHYWTNDEVERLIESRSGLALRRPCPHPSELAPSFELDAAGFFAELADEVRPDQP